VQALFPPRVQPPDWPAPEFSVQPTQGISAPKQGKVLRGLKRTWPRVDEFLAKTSLQKILPLPNPLLVEGGANLFNAENLILDNEAFLLRSLMLLRGIRRQDPPVRPVHHAKRAR
jgi:hypothetical protein